MQISRRAFEAAVAKALKGLPQRFREKLDNVAVVIEDEPTEQQLRDYAMPKGDTLFGLYEGIPQTERDSGYTFVLPDKITIFRVPICEACETPEDVIRAVQETVRHEIAHHFGISDERLEELERY